MRLHLLTMEPFGSKKKQISGIQWICNLWSMLKLENRSRFNNSHLPCTVSSWQNALDLVDKVTRWRNDTSPNLTLSFQNLTQDSLISIHLLKHLCAVLTMRLHLLTMEPFGGQEKQNGDIKWICNLWSTLKLKQRIYNSCTCSFKKNFTAVIYFGS